MKPRILHCAYSGLGGHAAVLFSLLDTEMRARFEHFVLFFGVEELRGEFADTCNNLGVPYAYVKKRGRLAFRSHQEVLRIIGEVQPDIIMVNGSLLTIPLLLGGVRRTRACSILVRETQANHLKSAQEWIGSFVAARWADAVVYLTDEFHQEVNKKFPGVLRRKGRVRVIPNGVEIDEVPPSRETTPNAFHMAMVSRIVPIKDHSTLIEAVRILVYERGWTRLRLFIAGEGPSLETLKAQCAAAGVHEHVVFTGMLNRAAVQDLLRSVHLYVHCTFGETMSNSILQAMAAGLPVVASDVKGVSNLLNHGSDGVLVRVGDAAALTDALDSLLRSPELRDSLGRSAHQRILRDLSRQRMVTEYSALFSSLASAKARGTAPSLVNPPSIVPSADS